MLVSAEGKRETYGFSVTRLVYFPYCARRGKSPTFCACSGWKPQALFDGTAADAGGSVVV